MFQTRGHHGDGMLVALLRHMGESPRSRGSNLLINMLEADNYRCDGTLRGWTVDVTVYGCGEHRDTLIEVRNICYVFFFCCIYYSKCECCCNQDCFFFFKEQEFSSLIANNLRKKTTL